MMRIFGVVQVQSVKRNHCATVVGAGATLNMLDRDRTPEPFRSAASWTGLLTASTQRLHQKLHRRGAVPTLPDLPTEAERLAWAEKTLIKLSSIAAGITGVEKGIAQANDPHVLAPHVLACKYRNTCASTICMNLQLGAMASQTLYVLWRHSV
jgi:hypothetical protein